MGIKARGKSIDEASQRPALAPRKRQSGRNARYLLEAWPEIIERMRGVKFRLLMLDFDGTLVRLRRRPEDVRLSERAKIILRQLAALRSISVAVVSGRDLKSIERLVGVKGVQYIGLHGAERRGKSKALSARARDAIASAKSAARAELKAIPGISIEDKGLSFAVHYRGAKQAGAEAAGSIVKRLLAASNEQLRVLCGKKVWEVLPREFQGKGSAALELFAELPEPKIAICIGDDETDEEAFAVLPGEITVKVGGPRETRANFYLRNPAEVLRCLSKMQKELR
ncbi:MAG: trehalose-phosphatase [Candidatus Acidiferrales bacterium]